MGIWPSKISICELFSLLHKSNIIRLALFPDPLGFTVQKMRWVGPETRFEGNGSWHSCSLLQLQQRYWSTCWTRTDPTVQVRSPIHCPHINTMHHQPHSQAPSQFCTKKLDGSLMVYVENATDDHIFRPFHCPDFHTCASSLSIVDILTNLHKEFGKTVSSHWMFDPWRRLATLPQLALFQTLASFLSLAVATRKGGWGPGNIATPGLC